MKKKDIELVKINGEDYLSVPIAENLNIKAITVGWFINKILQSAVDKYGSNFSINNPGIFEVARDITNLPLGFGSKTDEKLHVTIRQISPLDFKSSVEVLNEGWEEYFSDADEGGIVIALVGKDEEKQVYGIIPWDKFKTVEKGLEEGSIEF